MLRSKGTRHLALCGNTIDVCVTSTLRAAVDVGYECLVKMICDECALERGLATGEPGNCQPSGTEARVRVGCCPDRYAALAGNPPDQVISL